VDGKTAQAPNAPEVYEEYQAWPRETAEAVARYFLSAVNGGSRRCLVLGCATGVNDALPLARLAGPDDRIVAGDLENVFLERLRGTSAAEGLTNIESRRLDVTDDLSSLGRFDLVSLLFVIHRLKSWEQVIDRLCGLVAPGGSFLISEFVGPEGIIFLSNEGGGKGKDPVSRLIRRYFELLPERFEPALKSTSIKPVLDRLGKGLTPMGHQDFIWKQTLSPREMLTRIEKRAYAPFFSTHPTTSLLQQLNNEFVQELDTPVTLNETIRIYHFGKVSSESLPIELVEAFRHESDPARRATALQALVALEVGSRRSGSGAAELVSLLETCAMDAAEPKAVREAAIIGLVFVSLERARKILPPLLEFSTDLRARSIDLLEAVTFLERASSLGALGPAAVDLRSILRKHVAELVADPNTPPETREKGRTLIQTST
jgi:SAM-dependent methyltransferase